MIGAHKGTILATMDKRFLVILAALVVIFIGIFAVSQKSSDKSSSGGSGKAQPTNHIMGEGQKNVTLIEYGDYQCPICEAYYLPIKQVTTQFSKDIHFQFRNLPLVQVHPNAFAAARASEAAGLQNKYWEMHDLLYDSSNWQSWTTATNPVPLFNLYAQRLGLNATQFKQDYASSKVNDAINADLQAFTKTGQQQATPTFFLDGRFVANSEIADDNGPSVAKFTQLINAEIAKKTQ